MNFQSNQLMNATYMQNVLTFKAHTIENARMVCLETDRTVNVTNSFFLKDD